MNYIKLFLISTLLLCSSQIHAIEPSGDEKADASNMSLKITNSIVTPTVTNSVSSGDPAVSNAMKITAREYAISSLMEDNPKLTYAEAASIEDKANSTKSGPVVVYTTEKIPGADCKCVAKGASIAAGQEGPVLGEAACGNPQTRKYECTVQKGMTSFQNMIRDITKWFVYIIMLLGVLAIVGAGILWAMGSDSEEYTKKAKGWATNIIIGLILLFTFRYILGFLAPWIFR